MHNPGFFRVLKARAMSRATNEQIDTFSERLASSTRGAAASRDLFPNLRDFSHCYNRRIIV